ncbi:MAG: DJ-1/PfpI family protein [Alphaproteobacteria bacterium]|nr:DJ-1/PfpI family protein [Alphaproteobacteria bacterium]
MTTKIGFLLYPNMTQLDFTGPYEVLSRMPGAEVYLAAMSLDPIKADTGLRFLPDTLLEDCPLLDVLCVPGGPHVDDWFDNAEIIDFLKKQGQQAKYVTSVCTGSLILGAAGLLDGYRAATHWTSLEYLKPFGAIPDRARVVVDRNRITGGGVTAGIDFAFTVVAELQGEAVAKSIQLALEYNPAAPFKGGHPDAAEPAIVDAVLAAMDARLAKRRRNTEGFVSS